MALVDLIKKLITSSKKTTDKSLIKRYIAVKNYLLKMKEIRILIANSQNFGHQSSSVNILRSLIRLGCTAKFYIALHGSNQEDVDDLIKKIKVLIPQFVDLDTEFQIGGCKIYVVNLLEGPFKGREGRLAITGGYDKDIDGVYTALNCLNYIQLQPYAWDKSKYVVAREKRKDINLLETYKELNIEKRALYLPEPVVTKKDWEAISKTPYKNKGEIIKYLIDTAESGERKIDLYPVYGISTPHRSQDPAYSLYNIVAGLMQAKEDYEHVKDTVTVVMVFSRFTQEQWELFTDLKTNPETLKRIIGGMNSGQRVAVSDSFLEWHKENNVKDIVHIIGDPPEIATMQTVKEELERVIEQKKAKVVVLYLESIPAVLFDYLYFLANYPPVLEGQNTVELMLNIGIPYIKVTSSPYNYSFGYPSLPLGTQIGSAFAQTANTASYRGIFGTTPINWDNEEDSPTFPPATLKILFDAFFLVPDDTDHEPAMELAVYFDQLNKFYNLETEDKLLRVLDVFVNDITPVEKAVSMDLVESGDQSTLEELFNDIKNAIAEGVLNFLNTVTIPVVQTFFIDVVSDKFLIMADAKVTINDDKTEVKLVGNTEGLGIGKAALTFSFRMANNEIETKLSANLPDSSLSFPGMEWLKLSSPTLALSLNSAAPVPVAAYVSIVVTAGFTMTLSITIPSVKNKLLAQIEFNDPKPGISQMFQMFGGINLSAVLPEQVQAFTKIEAKIVNFSYDYSNNAIDYISISLGTPADNTWQLAPGIKLAGLSLIMQVIKPGDIVNRKTSFNIGGQFKIAEATIGVDAAFPGGLISGGFTDDSKPLGIGTFIGEYLSKESADALPAVIKNTNVTGFNFFADKNAGLYTFGMQVETEWKISLAGKDLFTIKELGFNLEATSSTIGESTKNSKTEITGDFSGSLVILPGTEDIGLYLYAGYLGAKKGWTFSASQTSGQVSLIKLFTGYLPEDWKPDPKKFDIAIDGLGVTIETATNSWEFKGKTAKPIHIPGIDVDISLDLKAGYNGGTASFGGRETITGLAHVPVTDTGAHTGTSLLLVESNEPAKDYFGTLSANIKWQKIELTVFYDFKKDYKAYGIKWGILEGKIVDKDGKKIATLAFKESTTVGSIVETMVGWATGSVFSLGAPWNILNSIPLNNLSLEYNLTDKQVGINVGIGPIEMGFARIDSIKVTYKSNQPKPEDNGVQVELTGSFRWQDDPSKPLGWNAAKPESTPAPEGQGNKYLDLRLLALGQHVTVPCFAGADTVQKAIECMKQLPVPDKDNITVPPVVLDANSSWLIGMEFGILRFEEKKKKSLKGGTAGNAIMSLVQDNAGAGGYLLTMQIIFNDPTLYALRFKLDGDAAKVFKGLDFQIMYKKISDSIGLYKAEITLPDKMRFIRMGQYNMTLPVFGIEYYTNGDFQVDIGFPWKADFSRSFTFQTLIWTPVGIPIPVMGSLGFYFGKLSGSTTSRVPKISNGTFNPVLVFGFGIQFGVGYTFDVGILRAGFSLTAVAIVEGILAKFNPYQITDGSGTSNQIDSSYYFWLRGTVGIIGKLFGTVDFAIIKADVNIDIRILASFTFAPYEDIVLNLSASVEIEVSISINLGLFKIRISFSFSAKISQSVTINAIGGNPPWQLAHESGGLLFASRRVQKRGLYHINHLRAFALNASLNWNNLSATNPPQRLNAYMGLGLTMAGDQAAVLTDQVACYVAMMFIESVAPPQDDRNGGIDKAFHSAPDTSFEYLAKMALRWVAAALQQNAVTPGQVDNIVIKATELQFVLNVLKDTNTTQSFSDEDINNFLSAQFDFQVEGPTTKKEMHATYFPVAPAMAIKLPKYGSDYDELSYAFKDYNNASENYLKFLRTYFDQLAINAGKEGADGLRAFALLDNGGLSLGSFIFRDYFLMICRQMIQSALDSLKEFKYFLAEKETVNDIVNNINKNAGLSGNETYTADELFTDNGALRLNEGKKIAVHGATYVVQAKDTFNAIAADTIFAAGFDGAALAVFNANTSDTLNAGIAIDYPGKPQHITQPGQSLAVVAKALKVEVADLINKAGIGAIANLPLPVATLALPDFSYNTQSGDTLRSIAAKFRITPVALALPAGNKEIADLFDKSASNALDIANLTQYKVGELIKEIQATQGLQHLSGMTSRYYMCGLRLPTKDLDGTTGIVPEKKGMWVTGDKPAEYKLPDFAGLYALTGQQFRVPALNATDNFDVSFENGGLKWLNFVNADKNTLKISIKPDSNDAKQLKLVKDFATTHKLDTGLTFLGMDGMFNTKESTYSFNSPIEWNAASAFAMPYGGKPPGVPELQLWQLPDPLLQLPDLSSRKINPRMALKTGEYSEATRGMQNHDLDYYGYASLIAFTIKKVPVIDASPATHTTYEVTGADGSSAKILERIVSGIGVNNNAIQSLVLAYGADANSTTAKRIQTDNLGAITMGLAQVNLSTETRPDVSARSLMAAEDGGDMVLLNEKTNFIRLLWEASITRSGGYFLYYFNKDNKLGLPDRIFNDKGEAQVSLIVIYSVPGDVNIQNTIGDYMNALVTGQAIDTTRSVLFAESNPLKDFSVPSAATQTLADLAYQYYGNVSTLALDNSDKKLRNGITVNVAEGTYIVGPDMPGGSLQAIADYFGTTTQAIKDANPKMSAWPDTLSLFTAIYLPATLTTQIGSGKGGNTLGQIAKYFGINHAALANHNKDITGIFDDGQLLTISGGPVITSSTVPAGNITMEAIRPKPAMIPDNPEGDDYGKIFLLNVYSLLSYQVKGNIFFGKSKLGLPASPATQSEHSGNLSKVRAPKAIAEGEDWRFRIAVPYNQFSLQGLAAVNDLPDPGKSPYKGLGDLLQIDFAWQDIYGNQLITNLKNPSPGDKAPLNMSPVLTGYNDPIIGLNQWPSVGSAYSVVTDNNSPVILLSLTFDASAYQGLMSAKAIGTTTINAVFTEALEKSSAESIENYTLNHDIKISSATLLPDNNTVALTINNIPENTEIVLNVANVSNAGKSQVFQGLAKFYSPEDSTRSTSTLLEKAKGDLHTLTSIWYQLTDRYGISYTVDSSLVTDRFLLNNTQMTGLVHEWLASIWKFVNDRAQGQTSIGLPMAKHQISFAIDESKLNAAETFKLDMRFIIERTGGAVMGDLETTGGIKSVSTGITPYSGTAGTAASGLTEFEKHFEDALSKTGVYRLKIATGIDRNEKLSKNGGNELWVVRLGIDNATSISYKINEDKPLIFAPKPVSTRLESRSPVPIWDFHHDKVINFNSPADRYLDFSDIDMDVWAQKLFGKIDDTLSSEYTAAIQLVDKYLNTRHLQTMLENKKALAEIIKVWMSFVFEGDSGSTAEIREAFKQQLLVRLSNAYVIKAGVQYSATVDSGEFRLFYVSFHNGDSDTLSVLFTSDIAAAVAENKGNYTISDGLTVLSATLDLQNAQLVTLKLSGKPIENQTIVSVKDNYTSAAGKTIKGSLTMKVAGGTAATPQLYGTITQNFMLIGAAVNEKDHSQVFLYFSDIPDKNAANDKNKYLVPNLVVNSATLDENNQQVVILALSGDVTVDTTTVNIVMPFPSASGLVLSPVKDTIVRNNVDVSHRTQGISITTARLNLKNSNAVPLPFLLSAPQLVRSDSGAILPYVDIDTSYEGSSIEHQINTLPEIADYRASSWLSFLSTPQTFKESLGAARVPMILRAFPAPPAMVKQAGAYLASEEIKDISNILKWDYMINYTQTVHYPQDQLYFTVNFNVFDKKVKQLTAFNDAFNPLAEFNTVSPDIDTVFREKLMKIDATTTSEDDFKVAAVALGSFNAIVGEIIRVAKVSGITMLTTDRQKSSNMVDPYKFTLKEGTGTVGIYKDVLVVTVTGAPPLGIDNPTVEIPGYKTEIYGTPVAGKFSFYFTESGTPLTAAIGQGIGARTVRLKGLNILARQDVETVAELKRNIDLVPDKVTVADFVYTTGAVGFVNIFHPMMEYNQDFDISSVGGEGNLKDTLNGHLTRLFTALLKNNSQETLSFLMTNTYSYQSNAYLKDLDAIQLPIMMQPLQTFQVLNGPATGDSTLKDMIGNWSNSIQTWLSEHQASTIDGKLWFDLTIFSNLTEEPMPLLRLTSLFLELKYITDISEINPMKELRKLF